jgi:hypothetical protein
MRRHIAAISLLACLGCATSQSVGQTTTTTPANDEPRTVVPPSQPVPPPATGPCLVGAEAEQFLATAEIVDIEAYETKGITHPRRATLSAGERTCRAVFKDVEETHDREQLSTGKWLLNLKDSYKHEIAAWKLDQLLGLGLVPPCVERTVGRDTGALCMWVEGAMTEYERARVENITPPDVLSYNDQMHDIKLFMQLTWETDYNNTANILIDGNWKLYKIDSSRAFRTDAKLRREETLTRFRRNTLDALKSLTRASLDEALSPWLDRRQIDSLWKRRGRILDRAENLVKLQGEAAVLFGSD